jgi:hypothetical protein
LRRTLASSSRPEIFSVEVVDLEWLVLWCHFHHHFRHRPDVRLFGDANNLSIQMPNGEIIALPARGFMAAA